MRKFIAVKHEWFQSGYGFETKTINARNLSHAKDKVKAWQARQNDKERGLNHHETTLIDPREHGFEEV